MWRSEEWSAEELKTTKLKKRFKKICTEAQRANQHEFQHHYSDEWIIFPFLFMGRKYFCSFMFFVIIIPKTCRLTDWFLSSFFQHSICKLIRNWRCSGSQYCNRRCAFKIIVQHPAVAKDSVPPLFGWSSSLRPDWAWQGHLASPSRSALSSPPWLSNQRSSFRNGAVLEEVIQWVPDRTDLVVFSTRLWPRPDH